MTRQSRLWPFLAIAIALNAHAASCDDAAGDANVIAEYDMRDFGEVWTLPVTMRGNTYRFWIDTGSGRVYFDDTLRQLLGSSTRDGEARTSTQDTTIPLFRAPEASVGTLPIERRSYVGCIDLAAVKQFAGADISGILGSAFFRTHIIQLDFDHAVFRFLRSVPDGAGYAVPFDGDDMRPRCRCSLEAGRSDSFLIDSGLAAPVSSVTLKAELFDDLVAEARAVNNLVVVPELMLLGTETGGDVLGDFQDQPFGVLRRLNFAELDVARVRASRARFSSLGLRFISRFSLTIDFPKRTAYFRPLDGADADDFDAGVLIDRKGKRTLVRGVLPVGRAVGLGLIAGDEIVQVNGEDTAANNIFTLRRILGREGRDLTLKIRRSDDAEIEIRIPAR